MHGPTASSMRSRRRSRRSPRSPVLSINKKAACSVDAVDRCCRFASRHATASFMLSLGTVCEARQPPSDHGCFQSAAGFVVAPLTVEIIAGERQLVGSALVLAQHLDRRARWRFACAIEFCQSSLACCHLIFPAVSRRGRAVSGSPPACSIQPLGIKSAGMRYQCGICGEPNKAI